MFRFALPALLLIVAPCRAQTLLPPAAPTLEGTVSVQEGDSTRTAKLRYAAPETLRVETAPDDASGTLEQTLTAVGANRAALHTPSTKRVTLLAFNPVARPYRDFSLLGGGAANIALFGLALDPNNAEYTVQRDATKIVLTAKPGVGVRTSREDVRFGGTGKEPFYAAFRRATFDRPAQIEIALQNNKATRITLRDESLRETGVATVAYNGALPSEAVVSVNGVETARYRYNVQESRARREPDAYPSEADHVYEVAEPTAADLAEPDVPAGHAAFHRGARLWRLTEDFVAATKEWNLTAQQRPQATAPHFALFDAALQTRDATTAQAAVEKLRALLSDAEPEVSLRRAQLALLRRDDAGAVAALEPALAARPNHAPLLALRADIRQINGDFQRAASDWRALLAIPNVPARARLNAAEALRQLQPEAEVAALLTGTAKTAFAARQAGRSGDFPGAQTAWTTLTTSPDFTVDAWSHLVALAAVRGQSGESLRAWRELTARAANQADRTRANAILLNAWRKANRQDALRSALQNRALSSQATVDDLRVWRDFQRLNGSRADLQSALTLAAGKFPDQSEWQSQLAEALLSQASQNVRAQFRQALLSVEAAIKLEPTQPFYREQKLLILLQRDGETRSPETTRALDEFARDFADDPDAMLSLALMRARDLPAVPGSIALMERALEQGDALDANRHSFAFAARLSLAAQLRRDLKPDASARHYDALLRSAQTANEQNIVVGNLLTLLGDAQNTPAVAALFKRLGSELWPSEAWRDLMENVTLSLFPRRTKPAELLAELRRDKTGNAVLASAFVSRAVRARAQAAADAPDAPVASEEVLRRAVAADEALVAPLQALSRNASTPVSASRAAFLLAERASSRGDNAEALTSFALAATVEPRDADARFALAATLLASPPTASVEKAVAPVKTVDDFGRALPPNFQTLSRLVSLQLRANLNVEARATAEAAMNTMQLSPNADPGDYFVTAMLAARAFFATGANGRGAELYKALSSEQWSPEDRAAALLDLAARAQAANDEATVTRVRTDLGALRLSPQQVARARNLLASLD